LYQIRLRILIKEKLKVKHSTTFIGMNAKEIYTDLFMRIYENLTYACSSTLGISPHS